jgi:hypothetical protein
MPTSLFFEIVPQFRPSHINIPNSIQQGADMSLFNDKLLGGNLWQEIPPSSNNVSAQGVHNTP